MSVSFKAQMLDRSMEITDKKEKLIRQKKKKPIGKIHRAVQHIIFQAQTMFIMLNMPSYTCISKERGYTKTMVRP